MMDKDKTPHRRLGDNPARFATTCRMRANQMQIIASAMKDQLTRDVLQRQAREWSRMSEDAETRARSLRKRLD
jgi:hypothetical protein